MDEVRILPNKTFDFVNTGNPVPTVNPEEVGVSWLNLTTGEIFICIDNTVDANIWQGQLGTIVESDPYFANVVLLFNGDESTGDTTFVDEKGHTFTTAGNTFAQYQTRLGFSMMNFDGAADYVYCDHADFALGTADFTIEMFVRMGHFNSVNYSRIINLGNYGSNGTLIIARDFNTNNLQCQYYDGGSAQTPFGGKIMGVRNARWVAFQRASGVNYLWIDGVSQGSSSTGGSSNLTETRLRFGANASGSEAFRGDIGRVRITKGVARYNTTGAAIPIRYSYPTS